MTNTVKTVKTFTIDRETLEDIVTQYLIEKGDLYQGESVVAADKHCATIYGYHDEQDLGEQQ